MAKSKQMSTITGFRLPESIAEKAKYIAWYERETFTDQVVRLLENHVAAWEKKNGPITSELIAKSKKK